MGGLLAADIALVFRHRIIGIVNFDVPFLGMHPGIVKAGLGSLFSPSPAPQDAIIPDADSGKRPSRMGTLFNPKPSDPNYNPSFQNDVRLPARKGWDNTLHWLSKHYSDGLRQATKGLIKSHFEFGSAMADYRELKDRYAKVRGLEEDDDQKRLSAHPNMRAVPRVRFVNYYTASTGRPKKPKSPRSPRSSTSSRRESRQQGNQDYDIGDPNKGVPAVSQVTQHEESDEASDNMSQPEMTHIDPEPIADSPRVSAEMDERPTANVSRVGQQDLDPTTRADDDGTKEPDGPSNLPQIPPIPKEPAYVDLMQFTDRSQRKMAEKEHDHALKEYHKAVKARNKVIKEYTKLEDKWHRENDQARAELKQRQMESDQRQAEAEQRQAEADQRRKEAEQRMTEGERQQADARKRSEELHFAVSDLNIEPESPHQITHQPSSQVGVQTPYAHYDFSRSVIMNQAPPSDRASITDSGYTLSTTNSQMSHQTTSNANHNDPVKPKKLKKFCMLPPKDGQGNKDPTWVKVSMVGMDEVTAHTSLFFVSETYERLVGDVGDRIEDWVREADSVRLVREMEGLN